MLGHELTPFYIPLSKLHLPTHYSNCHVSNSSAAKYRNNKEKSNSYQDDMGGNIRYIEVSRTTKQSHTRDQS